MDYRNWYCVMVASGCEAKARADLMARKGVVGDRFITEIAVPERSELTFDKKGNRKVVKSKLLPGYILVQVQQEEVEQEDGTVKKCFPAFTQKTIRDTFNVLGFAGANKNKPRQMRPSEVKALFARVDDAHLEVKQNVQVDYNVGDTLDVITGPFEGQTVVVSAVQGGKILGHINLLGRTVPAEFSVNQVYRSES